VTQHALQAITADKLHRGRDEFDYRVDVYRVTQHALQAITADMLQRASDLFRCRVDVCASMHCRQLQRTCYTGAAMSLITVWMCVV
jgi:cytosine/adenosine deaminase-related metal-dependent hydrolase